ncbi:hypothetical protein D3C85_1336490 [compost metagenome]
MLGGAAAGAGRRNLDLQRRDGAFDLELLAVGRAMRGHHRVQRQRQLAALQELLQQGLGVLAQGLGVYGGQYRLVLAHDHATGGVKPRIQEDGAENRFDGVGQDGRTAEAAALQFAFAQAQVLGQFQPLGDIRQRRLFDQIGPQARQIAFVDFGIALEQHRRHDEVQHGIPKEFQPLVMARAMTAMRQCLFKQGCITEVVIQAGF